MKNSLCAHCIHAIYVSYGGFFCEETGYSENKTLTDKCNKFEYDALISGYWIEAIPDSDLLRCSVCDGSTIAPRLWNGEKLSLDKFCRFCGAKMESEEKNDN